MESNYSYILYSLTVVLVIGVILNLIVAPFLDTGLSVPSNPTFLTDGLNNVVDSGNIFGITNVTVHIPLLADPVISVPNPFKIILPDLAFNFLKTQIAILALLPETIQYIIGILLLTAIGIATTFIVIELAKMIGGFFTWQNDQESKEARMK